jgi:hypothetical protein
MNLLRISAVHFTFELWRAGSLLDLGIQTKEWSIIENSYIIRNHAVGFTEGHRLCVRPKLQCVAVMFFFNNEHFWTHLTIKEFLICFPYLQKKLLHINS